MLTTTQKGTVGEQMLAGCVTLNFMALIASLPAGRPPLVTGAHLVLRRE